MELGQGIGGPTLDQTSGIKCEVCGCEIFKPAVILRKVSKLLIGSQNDGIIPINVFSCAKCGHVNMEFVPNEIDEIAEPDECEVEKTGNDK